MFPSRTRAAASVLAGDVLLLPGRRRADKPGSWFRGRRGRARASAPQFASRGGIKLANALDALAVDVAGRSALDVGASTGGFTDCLLQRGAAHVVALDVAYGELDWRLRNDPRVTVIERRNARSLRPDELPVRARPDRDRRLLHLAGEGAAGRAGVRGRALRLPGAGQAPVRGRPRRRGQGRRRARSGRAPRARWSWSRAAARSWARPWLGLRARACRARKATSRRSCGSPRRRGPVAVSADVEAAPVAEVEP